MADFAVQTNANLLSLPGLLLAARAAAAELEDAYPGQVRLTKVATPPAGLNCVTVNNTTDLRTVVGMIRALTTVSDLPVEVLVVIPHNSLLERLTRFGS